MKGKIKNLVETGIGRLGTAVQKVTRRSFRRRAASGILALSMVMTNAGLTSWAVTGNEAPEDHRVADGATWNDWKSNLLMDMSDNSLVSGRVWTDKSVFKENVLVTEDNDPLKAELGPNEFMEVFSALGSSQQYMASVPCDTVIVFDNSESMYNNNRDVWTDWGSTRIAMTVSAINTAVDKLMRANDYNRVSIVLFGDGSEKHTARVIIPMGHYPVGENGKILEYLKAGWANAEGVGEDSGNEPIQDQYHGHGGFTYVNNEVLKNGKSGYDAYRNGTTNIQAGIYVGMDALMHSAETRTVNLNETTEIHRIPKMILLTDGQATDAIKNNAWINETGKLTSPDKLESAGFVNDLIKDKGGTLSENGEWTSKEADFIGKSWNQFIKEHNPTDETDLYKYELMANSQADGKKDVADYYKTTQEYILLSTLITAGYMSRRVNEAYDIGDENKFVSTISVDMPEAKEIAGIGEAAQAGANTNEPLMNPSAGLAQANWIHYVGKYLQNTGKNGDDTYVVSRALKDAVKEAFIGERNKKSLLAEWRSGALKSLKYMEVPNANKFTNADRDARIKGYTESYRDTGFSHNNFWIVEEPQEMKLPNIPEDERKNITTEYLNYVEQAKRASTTDSASNKIEDIFKELVSSDSKSVFSPVKPATGEYLTYSDPIGDYMEIKGDYMTIELFGKTYSGTLTQYGDGNTRTLELAYTVIGNPGYGINKNAAEGDDKYNKEFNLKDIIVTVEKAENGKETLTVKIPAAALPVSVASLVKSGANTYEYSVNKEEPLRLYYKVGLSIVDEDGNIDLGRVSSSYLENPRNVDENGNIKFFTNDWSKYEESSGTSVKTTFEPNPDNDYYKEKEREYYQKGKEPQRDTPTPDQSEPKTSNKTETYENAYEPDKSGNEVESKLGNNAYVYVPNGSLLITKRVVPAKGVTVDTDEAFTFTLNLGSKFAGKTLTAKMGTIEVNMGEIKWTVSKDEAGQENVRSVSFDGNGAATITLKHNEGIKFTGLPIKNSTLVQDGEGFRVDENLTGDQIKGGYSLKSVVDFGNNYIKDGNGAFGNIVKHGNKGTEVHFTNTYAPTGLASLYGMKHMEDRPVQDGEFTFTLTPASGNPASDPIKNVVTVHNDKDGKITFFEDVEYTEVGDYMYTVKEIADESKQGINYDPITYNIKLSVTYNPDEHSLVYKVFKCDTQDYGGKGFTTETEISGIDDGIQFINSYNITENVWIWVEGVKVLEKKDLKAGDFRFEIIPKDVKVATPMKAEKKITPKEELEGGFEAPKQDVDHDGEPDLQLPRIEVPLFDIHTEYTDDENTTEASTESSAEAPTEESTETSTEASTEATEPEKETSQDETETTASSEKDAEPVESSEATEKETEESGEENYGIMPLTGTSVIEENHTSEKSEEPEQKPASEVTVQTEVAYYREFVKTIVLAEEETQKIQAEAETSVESSGTEDEQGDGSKDTPVTSAPEEKPAPTESSLPKLSVDLDDVKEKAGITGDTPETEIIRGSGSEEDNESGKSQENSADTQPAGEEESEGNGEETGDDKEPEVKPDINTMLPDLSGKEAEDFKFGTVEKEDTEDGRTVTTIKSKTGETIDKQQYSEKEFEYYDEEVEIPLPVGPVVVSNEADGSFRFGKITFEHEGVYTYEIRELIEDELKESSIDYDPAVYTLVVTVKLNPKTGKLQASKKLTRNGSSADKIVFTNTYNPPKLTIEKEQEKNETGRTKEPVYFIEGDTITYYLTVTNPATPADATKATPSDALDVRIWDQVPEGLKFEMQPENVSDYDKAEYDEGSRTLVWLFDKLEAGEKITVSFKATIPDATNNTGVLTWENTAYTTSGRYDGPKDPDDPGDDPKNNPVYRSNTVYSGEGVPKVTIEKEQQVNEGDRNKDYEPPRTVNADDVVTYYLTVHSSGSEEAVDVHVKDMVPEGLELVEIHDDGVLQEDGKTIIWDLGDMPGNRNAAGEYLRKSDEKVTREYIDEDGVIVTEDSYKYEPIPDSEVVVQDDQTRTVSFSVKVPAVRKYTKWLNVASTYYENNPDNPEDPEEPPKETPSNEVQIDEYPPHVIIEKFQSRNGGERTKDLMRVYGGDEVTYYLKVTNNGQSKAINVHVKDTVPYEPEQLTLVNANGGTVTADAAGRQIIDWAVGDLAVGESKEVSFVVRIPDGNNRRTWRNIGATYYDNNPDNPEDPNEPPTDIPSNEVVIEKYPTGGGNPGGGNPGGGPGGNPGTSIPDNPTPLANFPDSQVPLGTMEILDEDVPLAFLAPQTGDETPVGVVGAIALAALGLMGAFAFLGFRKKEDSEQ